MTRIGGNARTRQLVSGLIVSIALHAVLLSALGPASGFGPHRRASSADDSGRLLSALLIKNGAAPSTAEREVSAGEGAGDKSGKAAESRIPRVLPPALSLPFHETFFTSSQLDELPQPLGEVVPRYPAYAFAREMEGWVRLTLTIDEAGQLRHLEVIDSSPAGVFEDAALDAFRGLAFTPGKRGEAAVKSRVVVKVDFEFAPLVASLATPAVTQR